MQTWSIVELRNVHYHRRLKNAHYYNLINMLFQKKLFFKDGESSAYWKPTWISCQENMSCMISLTWNKLIFSWKLEVMERKSSSWTQGIFWNNSSTKTFRVTKVPSRTKYSHLFVDISLLKCSKNIILYYGF